MPTRASPPVLRVNSFQVLIGDREVAVAQVGRLSSRTTVDEHGERHDHGFETVTLRRALSTSTDLYAWRRRFVAGRDDRRDVTIRQLSAPGGAVVNAWRLTRAWPVRWSGPAFDAMSGEIAWEELELAFDDLEWLDP